MKKNILFIILSLLLSCFSAEAQFCRLFRKKKPKIETEVKKSKYEKILTDKKCESHIGTFMSLHKTDGKIYVEMPLKNQGVDVLVAATFSSVSNPSLATTGLKNSNPLHMRFLQRDSMVVVELVNTTVMYDTTNTRLGESIGLNFGNVSIYSYKIEAYNKDSSAVVFDMTPFFLKENKFFPILGEILGPYKINSTAKDEISYVYDMKVFEKNICVKAEKSFLISLADGSGATPIENYPVTFQIAYTIMQIPEIAMTPRISDTRLGVFQTEKFMLDSKTNQMEGVSFVKRWRIEPADTVAFRAGQLSEPKKPIVFYVDSAFPEKWKEPIKKGILRWNKAFEKIGFKNVIHVHDFPTNNPSFDPDNLQYSCVRYVPIAEENAMGPSWIDPRTGEIINASVFVYHDITKLINNWRFVQTAQIDPRVRTKKLSDEIIEETMEYIVAHEVGHTLGFMHNMASSAAYPADSLRSPSFTAKYGTTASIMDYARFNYIAQPEDKGVSLMPPYLGVFDYFLVEWTYKVFPELKNDYKAEAKKLNEWVDSHAGNPLYRYGVQQFGSKRYDPSALEEDLGDDPLKGGDYGLKNLRYILSNLDKWITDDEDSMHKTGLYSEMALQAYRYTNNVYMNLAGIYLTQTSEKSGIPRYKVVPKEKQKASALWLLDRARDFAAMGDDTLEKKLYAAGKPFKMIAEIVRKMAVSSAQRVSLSFYLDSTSYSPLEYCADVYQNVFEKTIQGKEDLTTEDMELQKTYVNYLKPYAESASRSVATSNLFTTSDDNKLHIDKIAYTGNDYSNNKWEGLHLAKTQNKELQQHAQFKTGKKSISKSQVSFGSGYGTPIDLWMQAVDNSQAYLLYYAKKVEELLEKRSTSTSNSELKLHYLFLLKRLKNSMEK